jgi:hypothetical protein
VKILILGNLSEGHVGAHLLLAANDLGCEAKVCDSSCAFEGPRLISKLSWWFRGKRPIHLGQFCANVVKTVKEERPSCVLSTGIAPLDASSLKMIGKMGVRRLNYLTDDPWNPAHRASWFLKALPFYDHVFSVRKTTLSDLRSLGCKVVSYLPFAYSPASHYAESFVSEENRLKFDSDIVFIGGADHDRVSVVSALIKAGFKVRLYGGYWDRFPQTQHCYCGMADSRTMRLAIAGAKVALCLVRRANRDGNSMRTFEIPAIGGCMLTEDTDEHRELFGDEGRAVLYFKTAEEMVHKAGLLLSDSGGRKRLAKVAHELVVQGNHTYKDRLAIILRFAQQIQ